MPASKAQQKAVHKYVKNNYDRMELTVPKGRKETIKAHAEARGESTNAFIGRAILETMERDAGGQGTKLGGLCEPSGEDTTTFQPLPPGSLEVAFAAAKAIGEKPADFIVHAIKAHAGSQQEAAGAPPGEVVSLPSETIKTAQEAAQAAGEGVSQFFARAVETQAQRDALSRRIGGDKPNE